MTLRIRVTKRGEVWSCCEPWRSGDGCKCCPYIVEWFDGDREVYARREGPRPSDSQKDRTEL